jgi:DNA-binding PadR family transcriptional regulator
MQHWAADEPLRGRWRPGPWGPGPGDWWRPGPGAGAGRRRRGQGAVRRAILALLAERPMHGYEMIGELEQRTGGVWRPSPGSIYPTLQLLEDAGLVRVEADGDRRRYSLTDAGREQAEQMRSLGTPWEHGGEGAADQVALRRALWSTAAAARQVALVGDAQDQQAATEILVQARRSLYRLLGGLGEPEDGGD